MQSIPLGKIAVPTAGTPVPITLTAAQQAMLSAAGLCAKVEAYPDPAATGTVYVKQAGVTLAALPKPTNVVQPWSTGECDRNVINPLGYQIDAATNGDGAFVTVWVE
jgi:hypothetical protein